MVDYFLMVFVSLFSGVIRVRFFGFVWHFL